MLRPHLRDLPPLDRALAALPGHYAFRTYRPGDEAGWAALMNTGQMDRWDVARTREKLTGRPWPQFDPDGLFLITTRGAAGGEEIVGSACAWLLDPAETEVGTLHMVCVLPEHRGARLSYPLCLAVLHRFRERGFSAVRLNTGSWRLGAVKTYLRLGFQPWYLKPGQPALWRDTLQTLGWTEPVEPIPGPDFRDTPES
ncbi:MAG TPA: GNAT family N-acetyltransferase [Chloroflexota bacterium]|nr:GNAT family N-acetyltransferase [Chloroflexota bacterium]